MDETLGRELKVARVKAGLTQEELSKKSKISVTVICQTEKGKRSPSKRTLDKLKAVVDF